MSARKRDGADLSCPSAFRNHGPITESTKASAWPGWNVQVSPLVGPSGFQETKVNPANHSFGGAGANGRLKVTSSSVSLVHGHGKDHQQMNSVSVCFTFYLQSWCFNEWFYPDLRCSSVKIPVGLVLTVSLEQEAGSFQQRKAISAKPFASKNK